MSADSLIVKISDLSKSLIIIIYYNPTLSQITQLPSNLIDTTSSGLLFLSKASSMEVTDLEPPPLYKALA